jgi:hypothetical protein
MNSMRPAPVNGGALITQRIGRSVAASNGAASLLVVFTIAAMVASAPVVRADDVAQSNLDLMTQLSYQVAEEVLAKFQQDLSGKHLQVRPYGTTEEYVFLSDVFVRLLEERGIEAVVKKTQAANVTAQPAAGEKPYVLDFKLPIFRLSYPEVYREHMVGGKKVRREASIRVSAKLLSDTGDVVWIGESSADQTDQFSYGDRARVQEGSYVFTEPEIPSSSWGKIVEPVFVSAIIVGMIYLFFSNQSDS